MPLNQIIFADFLEQGSTIFAYLASSTGQPGQGFLESASQIPVEYSPLTLNLTLTLTLIPPTHTHRGIYPSGLHAVFQKIEGHEMPEAYI